MKKSKKVLALVLVAVIFIGIVPSANASSIVTVINPTFPTSININKTSIELDITKTAKLKASVFPSNASNKRITWKSSNSKIASVDSKGKITAKSYGETIISAVTSNGKISTAKVIVNDVIAVFLGNSSVIMLKVHNKSYGRYKAANKTLTYIYENGSDLAWQTTNAALGIGGEKLVEYLLKVKQQKKYVRFLIVVSAPGNSVLDSKKDEVIQAGAYAADCYNYLYNQIKSQNIKFNFYVMSLFPLEPNHKDAKQMKIVSNSSIYALENNYRSPIKYTLFNRGLKTQINNKYANKIRYIDLYSNTTKYVKIFKTYDGLHVDETTSKGMFKYIMNTIA